jgi:aspartate oxidase
VDIWAQSSLPGCYAVGEIAGTHGVTRPGGAALNAGQVFGLRCAEHIHARADKSVPHDGVFIDALANCAGEIRRNLNASHTLSVKEVRDEIQARMSDKAGFICRGEDVDMALREAAVLNASLNEKGIRIENPAQIAKVMLWKQMALTSEAVLSALSLYIENGGGSRGARLVCSASGTAAPETRTGTLEEYRFRVEREVDRKTQIRVRYRDGRFETYESALRAMHHPGNFFFEKNWAPFLTGRIYLSDLSEM